MSDPITKVERSKAKDARQIPVQEKKTKRPPAKKAKPILVQWKTVKGWFGWHRDWSTMGRYKTREIAEKVIKDDKRKHPDYYEYRIIENKC